MEDIGSRLRTRRKELKLTQGELGRKIGVSAAAISQLEKGESKNPSSQNLLSLAKTLHCSPDWLQTGKDISPKKPSENHPDQSSDHLFSELVNIPVYDAQLAAGSGTWADGDTIVDSMPFLRAWLTKNGLPCIGMVVAYATGESMHPTIKDGDTLLIDTNQKRPVADQVFGFANGDSELRVKRLSKRLDGMWVIRSDSSDLAYRDEVMSPQDISGLHIIGRVVKVIGDL
ncbi:MAG: helix-turn-helix domain-containing protein [Motiliproteus sp.]